MVVVYGVITKITSQSFNFPKFPNSVKMEVVHGVIKVVNQKVLLRVLVLLSSQSLLRWS